MGKYLSREKITRLYSSDYSRAVQTATAILRHSTNTTKLQVKTDVRLRERVSLFFFLGKNKYISFFYSFLHHIIYVRYVHYFESTCACESGKQIIYFPSRLLLHTRFPLSLTHIIIVIATYIDPLIQVCPLLQEQYWKKICT